MPGLVPMQSPSGASLPVTHLLTQLLIGQASTLGVLGRQSR